MISIYSVLACRVVLGLLLLSAALAKLRSPKRFAAVLETYGVRRKPLAFSLAVTLPVVELLLGGSLLLGVQTERAGLVASALVAAFTLVILAKLVSGVKLADCGCGWRSDPLSYRLVLRNAGVLVLGLGPAFPETAQYILLGGVVAQASSAFGAARRLRTA